MTRILIIDDSKSMRDSLKNTLEAAGYQVVEAEDGSQGLDYIVNDRLLDLVITDNNMPGFDGITMLERAHQRIGPFAFPVFMLTTETSESMKESGRQVGVVAWIVKPFSPEKLLMGIKKVLEKKSK